MEIGVKKQALFFAHVGFRRGHKCSRGRFQCHNNSRQAQRSKRVTAQLAPAEGDPGPTFVNINSEKVQIRDKNRPNDDHMECSLLIIHYHSPSTSFLLHEAAAV